MTPEDLMFLRRMMNEEAHASTLPLPMQEILFRGRQLEEVGGVGGTYVDPEEVVAMMMNKAPGDRMMGARDPRKLPKLPKREVPTTAVAAFRGQPPKKRKK